MCVLGRGGGAGGSDRGTLSIYKTEARETGTPWPKITLDGLERDQRNVPASRGAFKHRDNFLPGNKGQTVLRGFPRAEEFLLFKLFFLFLRPPWRGVVWKKKEPNAAHAVAAGGHGPPAATGLRTAGPSINVPASG